MDQHPVPRQITSFEFKLIGFLTIRQFGYLATTSLVGLVLFFIIPIPYVNILLALAVVGVGFAFVFIPIRDRPMDVWIKNFVKKMFSPSQYYYVKKNKPPRFFKTKITPTPVEVINTHIDAYQKLSSYLQLKKKADNQNIKKQRIYELFHAPTNRETIVAEEEKKPAENWANTNMPSAVKTATGMKTDTSPIINSDPSQNPFLYGIVKNSKDVPLPNILVYIKDDAGKPLRILKTNHNGVFATFHPLIQNTYAFELKDLGQKYFFDTMKYTISQTNKKPFYFFSKEIL